MDVAYSPGFHTNIVSCQRLEKANVFWDSRTRTVYQYKNKRSLELCTLSRRGQLNFVAWKENLSVSATKKSAAPRVMKGNESDWHKRMGHVGKEVIEHLEESTKGVKIMDLSKGTKLNKNTRFDIPCEGCA